MKFVESFRIAVRALGANKVRSALTMLGVIIGVSAVILLVAIGSGVQAKVTSTIQGFGGQRAVRVPRRRQPEGGGFSSGAPATPFQLSDAEHLQQQLTGVDAVVPVAESQGTIRYLSRSILSTLVGSTAQGYLVSSAKIGGGRYFNSAESDGGARVAIIGWTVRTRLFPNGEDPTGLLVTINGQKFRVIGWYQKQGGGLSGDQDNQAAMPISALQSLTANNQVSIILVKVTNASNIPAVKTQIMQVLAPRFGDQITIFTQDQTLGVFNTLLGTLTIMLAGIAGISLLVGGIGIMNIMLVSVSERTREIGIRKAVGARTYDILSQFVIEAVLLSVAGGAVGIGLGALGALALSSVVPTQVTAWAVVVAFVFSACVGVFFGVYPAWRASRLDPIEALRYE